jgi:hypothetical protein
MFALWLAVLIVINIGPLALEPLERQTIIGVSPTPTPASPAASPPSQVSYTADSQGHKHWTVNIFDQAIGTESITTTVSHDNLVIRFLRQLLEMIRLSQHLTGLVDIMSLISTAGYFLLGNKKVPKPFGFVTLY